MCIYIYISQTSMITGKATREFVPPKCNRVEFGHHARQQASIGHSHGIHTPRRLQGTRKPAARVSPNRPPQPLHTHAHRRQRTPAARHCLTFIQERIHWNIPNVFDMHHPVTISVHCPSARLVRVVVRPTGCTTLKAHVTPM